MGTCEVFLASPPCPGQRPELLGARVQDLHAIVANYGFWHHRPKYAQPMPPALLPEAVIGAVLPGGNAEAILHAHLELAVIAIPCIFKDVLSITHLTWEIALNCGRQASEALFASPGFDYLCS